MIGLGNEKKNSFENEKSVLEQPVRLATQKVERVRKPSAVLNSEHVEDKKFSYFNGDVSTITEERESVRFFTTGVINQDVDDDSEETTEMLQEVESESSSANDELRLAMEECIPEKNCSQVLADSDSTPVEAYVAVSERTEPSISESLLNRIKDVVVKYNDKNSGVVSSEVKIFYCDDTMDVKIVGGQMLLPIRKVYLDGIEVPFDGVGEVRISMRNKVEVDLGMSVAMPNNVNLQLEEVDELTRKFGLKLRNPILLCRQDAAYPIVLELTPVDELAYISKFQSVIQAKFVTV